MTRNEDLINITNRLNYLRLERNRITKQEAELINLRSQIATEEAHLFRSIKEHVFVLEGPEPVLSEDTVHPVNIKVEEDQYPTTQEATLTGDSEPAHISDTEVTVKREPYDQEETPDPIPNQELQLGVFKGSERIAAGTRVYINNKISHHQEGATESALHRLATVLGHTRTGRVDLITDSGHTLWRKKKNLSLVLQE